MFSIQCVGSGVDTLILNVRYSDNKSQPVKKNIQRVEGAQSTLDTFFT